MRIYLGNEDEWGKNYEFVKEMAFGCVFCVSFQATPFFGAKKIPSEYLNNRILINISTIKKVCKRIIIF